MRINILTGPWLPVPPIQGGAVNRLWQGLAEKFAAKGHQVKILCRSYPGQPSEELINRVSYIRSGGFSQSTNIYIDLVKDLVYALNTFSKLPSGDILVINDFWLPIFASLRPKVGKIVINSNRFPKGQYWLYAKVARFAAASRVIGDAISQQYPAGISRIRVIPNPIDISIFSPPSSPRTSNKNKVILYVGRIHPEKGIHLLLEAFTLIYKQIAEVQLKILGPYQKNQGGGGEKYFHKLQIKSEKLPVEFIEPVFKQRELAHAYQEADLFCYPSLADRGEAFGVAPLEAMATGLVPIVSNLDCFRDFIDENKTGYFFEHRHINAAQSLASKLSYAINNWELTMQMSIECVQKAAKFNVDYIAEQYLSDFKQLIPTKR